MFRCEIVACYNVLLKILKIIPLTLSRGLKAEILTKNTNRYFLKKETKDFKLILYNLIQAANDMHNSAVSFHAMRVDTKAKL